MMQAITQTAIQAAKAAKIAVSEADNSVNTARPVQVMPRMGGPVLKQPTFDWKANRPIVRSMKLLKQR